MFGKTNTNLNSLNDEQKWQIEGLAELAYTERTYDNRQIVDAMIEAGYVAKSQDVINSVLGANLIHLTPAGLEWIIGVFQMGPKSTANIRQQFALGWATFQKMEAETEAENRKRASMIAMLNLSASDTWEGAF